MRKLNPWSRAWSSPQFLIVYSYLFLRKIFLCRKFWLWPPLPICQIFWWPNFSTLCFDSHCLSHLSCSIFPTAFLFYFYFSTILFPFRKFSSLGPWWDQPDLNDHPTNPINPFCRKWQFDSEFETLNDVEWWLFFVPLRYLEHSLSS